MGLPVGLVVVFDQILPKSDLRDVVGRRAVVRILLGGHGQVLLQNLGDVGYDLSVIRIVTGDHRYAFMFLELAVDPQPESGQRCGDRRYGEGDAFQRCVAPRFIIRGEYRNVHTTQQFIVALVEYSVGLVEVRGNENDLYR